MKISVVVAAFDEVANVGPLVDRLAATLRAMTGTGFELIFVVEGTDGTRDVLAARREAVPELRVLDGGATPSGLGAAFRRGFAAVGPDAEVVVTLDADLNHQPEEIPRLVAALEAHRADVVVGSRFVAGARVEGAPLWKRVLSGSVNRLMSWLYRLPVRDKTSGFRVYRAAALRALRFESPAFAFLPELLIAARAAGFVVVEEPIRFVFRREGTSKMRFFATSWSYLRLLGRRLGARGMAAVLLVLAGVVVRALAVFPVRKYPADADCLLAGLCALDVLAGEAPVFVSGYRLGSLGCHLTALLFAVLGPTRAALALGPLLVGTASLLAGFLFARELAGPRTAVVALGLLALPPPAVLFWTAMPNSYPEVLLLSTTILWLAARAARRRGDGVAPLAALGLAIGLGWWTSIQTVVCSAPALAWLAWRRPDLRRLPALLALAAAALLGAAPWLAFNLRYGLPSLRRSFPARPAEGLDQVADNARYFFDYSLVELLASTSTMPAGKGLAVAIVLRPIVLAIGALAAVGLLLPGRRRLAAGEDGHRGGAAVLLVGVALAVFATNVLSGAGSLRGMTVRYVLPLVLVWAAAVAVFLRGLAARSRTAAAMAVAALLAFHLGGVEVPWSETAREARRALTDDRALVALLEDGGVETVVGPFWQAYPVTFATRFAILGLPLDLESDPRNLVSRLDPASRRWAVVGELWHQPAAWVAAVGLEPVSSTLVGSSYRVTLLERPAAVSATELFESLRLAYLGVL